MSAEELRSACKLLGFPEVWAKSAVESGNAAVESLNDTVSRIMRAHGCGTVVVSHEALTNFTDAGISCLNDPQLAPLVASAVKEKVWKGIDEEREELLNIFRENFQPDIVRNTKANVTHESSMENISSLMSSAARYQGHIQTLQTHFSRSEGSYSLPVDVRRVFNNFTQDESQLIRQYSEGLHRSKLTKKPPPRDPSHPQKVLFLATFTRLMQLDKEKAQRATGLLATDDLATARTIESLYFAWLIEAWMELKALAVSGGRGLQSYESVVWHPVDRLRREWALREGLLSHAVTALKLIGDDSSDTVVEGVHTVASLAKGTQKLTLRSIASLLYGLQPHFRLDPLGNSDMDFQLLAAAGDDEESAVRRVVATAAKERAWRDIVTCIQPTQLLRQEAIEAERVVITQRHALNAFVAIVKIYNQNPFHSHHFYFDEASVARRILGPVHTGRININSSNNISSDSAVELREVIALAKKHCSAADALHACLATFVNSKPPHPFLEEIRRSASEKEPRDTAIINPLHPPFEIDFESILSLVVAEGVFDFGLMRYKKRSSDDEIVATRNELKKALWAPIVPLVGREADIVSPNPALLRAGPLLLRLLFWFIYCAFFNHKQVACYNHYYMDLAGHAINTVIAYVTEEKINSVVSFAVKADGPSASGSGPSTSPYRHHRGDSPSSIDFLPFVVTHAALLAFFRTFPSNAEAFTEKSFVGPASLLLCELFLGRRGVPTTQYAALRKRMFDHKAIRIALSNHESDASGAGKNLGRDAQVGSPPAGVDVVSSSSCTFVPVAGGDTDFLSQMIKRLNTHATNLSDQQRAKGVASNRQGKGSEHEARRGAPQSHDLSLSSSSTIGTLSLTPTDEGIIGELRRRVSSKISRRRPTSPLMSGNSPGSALRDAKGSRSRQVSPSRVSSNVKVKGSTSGLSPVGLISDPLFYPADVAELEKELIGEVCSMVSTARAVTAENQRARDSALKMPVASVGDTFFYKERRVQSPQPKRKTMQYSKIRSLSSSEERLLALTRAAIKADLSVPRGNSASHADDKDIIERLRTDVEPLVATIVKECLAKAVAKAQRKAVDAANDIFVDEDFHILNTRLVADPEYAKGIIKQRRASLSAPSTALVPFEENNTKITQESDGNRALNPAEAYQHEHIRRAKRLNALRDCVHQTFYPSHPQVVQGMRSDTALSRLALQLGQISTKIASRRAKVLITSRDQRDHHFEKEADSAGRNRSLDGTTDDRGHQSPSPTGSRPQSTSANTRRKTSSAIFSNSKRLSLFFNADASSTAGDSLRRSREASISDGVGVEEDDTMEGIEQELQSLMLPVAAVQCSGEAARVVEVLYADGDSVKQTKTPTSIPPLGLIEGSPSQPHASEWGGSNLILGASEGPSPNGSPMREQTRPVGTFADHIFNLTSSHVANGSLITTRNESAGPGGGSVSAARALQKPAIISSLPHHQPFQQTRIYDLPLLSTELRNSVGISSTSDNAPAGGNTMIRCTKNGEGGSSGTNRAVSSFGLEKDDIDKMFARPRSVAHFISRPHSQLSQRSPSAVPSVRSQSALAYVERRVDGVRAGATSALNTEKRGHEDEVSDRRSLDPSVDPSFEDERVRATSRQGTLHPLSASTRPSSGAFGSLFGVPTTNLSRTEKSGGLSTFPSAFSRPIMTSMRTGSAVSLGMKRSEGSGGTIGEQQPLLPPKPTRGGGRFLSAPRVTAPTNAAVEEVNLRSCSPAITRSVSQNARGAKIHMLAVTCQPTLPPPGAASRLAQALRDRNVEAFRREDDHRQEVHHKELAGMRSTARTAAKAEQELAKELQDPLRRTDFVDKWIANEPPKVSVMDPRDEVRVRQITKGASDVNGKSKLMWEGSRIAIEAKLNSLELKEVIRGAERHISKSTRKKGRH